MSISPRLAIKLDETLGREAAEDIVTVFDEIRAEMSGTKADLAELRQEMRIGLERIEGRFARMDARFEASAAQMDTQIKQSDARFDAVLFT